MENPGEASNDEQTNKVFSSVYQEMPQEMHEMQPNTMNFAYENYEFQHEGETMPYGVDDRAYAMIAWYDPNQGHEWHVHYLRELYLDIGRQGKQPLMSILPITQDTTMSRHHLRIQWDVNNPGFMLHVYGKNGVIMDGRTYPKDCEPILLRHGVLTLKSSRIEIGDVILEFRLPNNHQDSYTTYQEPPLPPPIPRYHDTEYEDKKRKRDSSATETFSTRTSPASRKSRHASASPYQRQTPRKKDDDDYEEGITPVKTVKSTPRNTDRPPKPSLSYVQMIQQAINSSPNKQMTLNGIYNYISQTWPYFDMETPSWQNTVRHNLSVNPIFKRVPKDGQSVGVDGKPTKGALWIVAE